MPPYRAQSWTDPRQQFRASPTQGIGAFARVPFQRGEVVEIVGGTVMTETALRAFMREHPRFNAIQIGEELHLVEAPTSPRSVGAAHSTTPATPICGCRTR